MLEPYDGRDEYWACAPVETPIGSSNATAIQNFILTSMLLSFCSGRMRRPEGQSGSTRCERSRGTSHVGKGEGASPVGAGLYRRPRAATEPPSGVSALRVTIPDARKKGSGLPASVCSPVSPRRERGQDMGEAAPQPRLRRRASAAGARRLRQGQAASIADPQEGPRPSQPDPARPHAPEVAGLPLPRPRRPHDGAIPGNRHLTDGRLS